LAATDPQALARKEHLLILLIRIATELFTMCAVAIQLGFGAVLVRGVWGG